MKEIPAGPGDVSGPRWLKRYYGKPLVLFGMVLGTVFLAEGSVMVILHLSPPLPAAAEVLVDSLLLSLFVFPVLYYLVFIPLAFQIRQREAADAERRKTAEFDRIKSDFISAAAHELHTPIAVIKGYAELLRDRQDSLPPGERRDYLELIDRKTEVLERIVDDLLTLNRLDRGRGIRLERRRTELAPVVLEAVVAAGRLYPDHPVVTRIDPDLPPLWVDPVRIGQVLNNLLSNAAKFSPAGSEIHLAVHPHGGTVEIEVRDAGIGLQPGEAAKVFDKFYRVDTSNTARGGLGLGLTIARTIVEGHGGRIGLESTPGAGTRVWFRLPCAVSAAA